MHSHNLITDLAFVLAIASVMGILARALKQPPVLGYLFAGLLVGPYIPLPIFADPQRVHALSELGVVLVMFAVGLELRLARFLRALPTSGITALLEVSALLTVGYLIATLFGWTPTQSIFLGSSIAISSTMIVSNIFTQHPPPTSLREHTMGVLVVQDVLAIVLAAVLTAIAAGQGLSASGVLIVISKLSLSLIAAIAVGLLIVPRAVRAIAKTQNRELLIVFCVGLCFGLAWAAEHSGYSVALGAFLAGILVAESGKGHDVEHIITPTRDIFAAIFFVAIGMTIDPRLAWEHLPTSLVVTAAVIFTQITSVTLASLLTGSPLNTSIRAGASLAQVGEFGFILSAIGVQANIAPPSLTPIIVTVAVLTACTTPITIRASEPFAQWVDRSLPQGLRTFLGIYTAWLERLRSPSNTHQTDSPTPLRRTLIILTLESTLATAIVVGSALHIDTLQKTLSSALHITANTALILSITLTILLALIPLIGFLRALRTLTAQLTASVLHSTQPSPLQRIVTTLFQSIIILCFGLPSTLVLFPIIGLWPLIALALYTLGATLYLWHAATPAAQQLQLSAIRIARSLSQHTHDDTHTPTEDEAHHNDPWSFLPNDLLSYTLQPQDFASRRSLLDLDLRAQTKANVLAIAPPHGESHPPDPTQPLEPHSTLIISGHSNARSKAQHLLQFGSLPEEPSESNPVQDAHDGSIP